MVDIINTEPRDRKAEGLLTWILKSSQITIVISNKFTTVKEQGNRLEILVHLKGDFYDRLIQKERIRIMHL